jgi:hypothetical protein
MAYLKNQMAGAAGNGGKSMSTAGEAKKGAEFSLFWFHALGRPGYSPRIPE